MRQLTVIIFSIIILIQTCQLSLMYSYYQLNVDYITEQFCVNKSRPEKSCFGQCHINKIAKDSVQKDSEEKAPLTVKEYNSPVIFLEVLEKLNDKTIATSNVLNTAFLFLYAYHPKHFIFEPPRV